jgi:hypothetical protein
MTDDEKVVQLRVAEVRLNAAYEDLKGQDEARQRQSCDGFAERFGKDQAEKLRQKLGLKPKAEPAKEPTREPAKEDLRQRFKDREDREARQAQVVRKADPYDVPVTELERPAELRKSDKPKDRGWPRHWPEAPLPPANAVGFERLLYPRGLLGHAVQYVMDTAPLPDRKLALAVSLSALAKGIDRKVIGPSDNSTVLFSIVIAETGAGKHHGISCSRSLLRAMGQENSIVASGLASVQAIEEIIEGVERAGSSIDPNPNALVVVDEAGSWLSRILSQSQNSNVSEIPGILQTLWSQPLEDGWISTKKVGKVMKTFYAVTFSIIGFSTEKMFFRSLKDRLVSAGFVNRMLLWNVGRGALERVDPKYSWTQCPKWLIEALQQVTALDEAPLNGPMKVTMTARDGSVLTVKDFHRVGWGPGVKERWLEYDNSIRAMPSVEDREFWIRAPDLTVRLATVLAVYRCSPVVEMEDWEWAIEVVRWSTEQLRRGVSKHAIEDMEQADLADGIRDFVRERQDGLVPIGELCKHFERKANVRKINEVLWHVVKTCDIVEATPEEVAAYKGTARGKPTTYFKWNTKRHRTGDARER